MTSSAYRLLSAAAEIRSSIDQIGECLRQAAGGHFDAPSFMASHPEFARLAAGAQDQQAFWRFFRQGGDDDAANA